MPPTPLSPQRAQEPASAPLATAASFEQEELDELRQRWRTQNAEGESLRDAMLRKLQARKHSMGTAPEPLDLRGLSLVGADLAGLDLTGCDLCGADLSRADLERATLFRCQLRGATMFETKLRRAELSGVDLTGANMQGVEASDAGFGQAVLVGASLFEADLSGATLTDADLRQADLRIADLREARLRDANLESAQLQRAVVRGADLTACRVEGSQWDHADLRGVRLDGLTGYRRASWIGVDIRDTDFTGAYLCRRHMLDQNYLEEFRTQSSWTKALYWLWWVTSDCGRSFVRWSLLTLAFTGAFGLGYTFVAIDYGPYETWLSPYYFSVVTLTTLGYGDSLPSSVPAQVLAMIEVLFGYVMLGGLLSIFSNKMARRGE